MLVALAKSPDREFTGGNAIMAMGSTGSRDAIPVLLEYLISPDINISDRANYALQLLTHRTAVRDQLNRDRQTESAKWSQWWKREGETAHIYKDTECGEMIPLPYAPTTIGELPAMSANEMVRRLLFIPSR